MSDTAEADEDLCPPAVENRRLGTAALGLESAGRSAELASPLFSASGPLGDPSRSQSSSPTKGEGHRGPFWRTIQLLAFSPRNTRPPAHGRTSRVVLAVLFVVADTWDDLNVYQQGKMRKVGWQPAGTPHSEGMN